MDIYRELAKDFINVRREHPYIRFDKEISAKIKNDIFVIDYLKRHNGAAHPKELSEEFMISTAQMAVILNQLEEKELVVRLHDPQSNRQTIVHLTPKGEQFFEEVNSGIIDFVSWLFGEIGEEDARSFVRIICRMMNVVAEDQ